MEGQNAKQTDERRGKGKEKSAEKMDTKKIKIPGYIKKKDL